MANMSYCRFHNTKQDLQDCIQAIENGEIQDLGYSEKSALRDILDMAERLTEEIDEIKEQLENNIN
jgi:hypothetical protein